MREPRDDGSEPWDRANDGDAATAPVGASWADAQAFCAWKERELRVALRLPTKDERRAIHPFHSERYAEMSGADFLWENYPPRPLEKVTGEDAEQRIDVPSAVTWSEPRFLDPGPDPPELPPPSGWGGNSRKRWIVDFPPRATRREDLPWAEDLGLRSIRSTGRSSTDESTSPHALRGMEGSQRPHRVRRRAARQPARDRIQGSKHVPDRGSSRRGPARPARCARG